MRAMDVLLVAIALLAFAATTEASRVMFAKARRKRVGYLPDGTAPRNGLLGRMVQIGVPGLTALVRRARSIGFIDGLLRNAATIASSKGYDADLDAIGSTCLAALPFCFAVGSLAARSPVGGVAVTACAVVLGVTWVRASHEKRLVAMREAVPDVLQSMRACFKSGLSMMQTLEHIAEEGHGGVGELFARGAHELRTGATSAEALSHLREAREVPELVFVSIALDVQHQAGGSILHVLDSAREMVEAEIELARSIRVQTAQAKMSSRVVSAMPIVLVALLSVVSPNYFAPFFEGAIGVFVLGLAVALQIAGVVAVQRALRVGDEP